MCSVLLLGSGSSVVHLLQYHLAFLGLAASIMHCFGFSVFFSTQLDGINSEGRYRDGLGDGSRFNMIQIL